MNQRPDSCFGTRVEHATAAFHVGAPGHRRLTHRLEEPCHEDHGVSPAEDPREVVPRDIRPRPLDAGRLPVVRTPTNPDHVVDLVPGRKRLHDRRTDVSAGAGHHYPHAASSSKADPYPQNLMSRAGTGTEMIERGPPGKGVRRARFEEAWSVGQGRPHVREAPRAR